MSTRIAAAVERMKLQPDDVVLEIGCGHGVAVDLICQRLPSAKVVAIDRSPKMIAAALRRNAKHVESGRAEFHVADLVDFDPQGRRFDAILALRVGIFHREPEKARAMIKRWLKPRGRIVAEYDEA
jgi:ubiquinone/menaquinone biosynthesis C-methylase UbiE